MKKAKVWKKLPLCTLLLGVGILSSPMAWAAPGISTLVFKEGNSLVCDNLRLEEDANGLVRGRQAADSCSDYIVLGKRDNDGGYVLYIADGGLGGAGSMTQLVFTSTGGIRAFRLNGTGAPTPDATWSGRSWSVQGNGGTGGVGIPVVANPPVQPPVVSGVCAVPNTANSSCLVVRNAAGTALTPPAGSGILELDPANWSSSIAVAYNHNASTTPDTRFVCYASNADFAASRILVDGTLGTTPNTSTTINIASCAVVGLGVMTPNASTLWLRNQSAGTGKQVGATARSCDPNQVLVSDSTDGVGIANATVTVGGSTVITDSTGLATLTASTPQGTEVEISASAGGYSTAIQSSVVSQTCTAIALSKTSDLVNGAFRVVLTWGKNPSDLDSHLQSPNASEIYYQLRTSGVCKLDRDDTDSFGPETVTCSPVTGSSTLPPGSYKYWVKHFSGDGTIATSSANVRLDQKSASGVISSQIYKAPASITSGTGSIWNVFELVVDGNGSVSVASTTPTTTTPVTTTPITTLTPQAITFGAAPTVAAGSTATITATGGASGNPVILTSTTPAVCTVSGTTVTALTAGTCNITGTQAANATYSAASNSLSFTIGTALASRYAKVGTYDITECVKDTQTGLIWEGKTASGLRAGSNTYSNYDDATQAQFYVSFSTFRNPTATEINASTNSIGYMNAVNATTLCGFNGGWRMPTKDELLTLVKTGVGSPTIDTAWFPNTLASGVWSGSPDAYYAGSAWYVGFRDGYSYTFIRYVNLGVLLVRGGQ